MNKNFADQITTYFKVKGYETEQWISRNKGGDTVETDAVDLIKTGERIINHDGKSISSANYRVIYLEGCEDDGGDEVILFKDYVVVKVPCRNKE